MELQRGVTGWQSTFYHDTWYVKKRWSILWIQWASCINAPIILQFKFKYYIVFVLDIIFCYLLKRRNNSLWKLTVVGNDEGWTARGLFSTRWTNQLKWKRHPDSVLWYVVKTVRLFQNYCMRITIPSHEVTTRQRERERVYYVVYVTYPLPKISSLISKWIMEKRNPFTLLNI